jgi:glycosyltransferase involved in cell wall biosynthesis
LDDHTNRHLAIIIGDLKPYGGQRVALELAKGLSKHFRVTIITFEGSVPSGAAPRALSHVHVPRRGRGPIALFALAKDVRRIMRRDHVTHVLTFMTYANLVGLIATKHWGAWSPAIVVTEHSIASLSLPASERHPSAVIWIMRLLYPRAHGIVGVSDAIVKDLCDLKISNRRLVRIYNPVAWPPRTILEGGGSPVPHSWLRIERKFRTLVMVGSLEHVKGHDIAINALSKMPPDYRLLIVGDGTLDSELRRLTNRLDLSDRVDFVGWQPQPNLWMLTADAVLVPSRWEGFGLVAVEAAFLGTPLVASAVGGLVEVTRLVGGVLVPSGDPAALAAAAQRANIDGVGVRLARAKLAAVEFDVESIVDQYVGVLTGE